MIDLKSVSLVEVAVVPRSPIPIQGRSDAECCKVFRWRGAGRSPDAFL